MKDKLGGRRFWLCSTVSLAACVLLWYGKLTGAEWVSLATWITGIYVVGNTGQRGIEAAQAVKVPENKGTQ